MVTAHFGIMLWCPLSTSKASWVPQSCLVDMFHRKPFCWNNVFCHVLASNNTIGVCKKEATTRKLVCQHGMVAFHCVRATHPPNQTNRVTNGITDQPTNWKKATNKRQQAEYQNALRSRSRKLKESNMGQLKNMWYHGMTKTCTFMHPVPNPNF